MSKTRTLITSRDPEGLQAVSIFEAAFNKAELDDATAQLLNERGDELKDGISNLIARLSVSSRFANQEVASNCGYSSGYSGSHPLADQVAILGNLFTGLSRFDIGVANRKLPEGAEGYFAIPRWQAIAPTYNDAVQKVLFILVNIYGKSFEKGWLGRIGPEHLRQSPKAVAKWHDLSLEQKDCDILIIPAQFGIRHRGRSPLRALEVMGQHEFGLGAFEVGIMLITHPNRLRQYEDLWIDCPGDEYHDPNYPGELFTHLPVFCFSDEGRLEFGTDDCDGAFGYYGSASGWAVPQS